MPWTEAWQSVEAAAADAVSSSHARHLLAGAAAGAVAKSVTAPLDRLKILFQVSKQRFTLTAAHQALRHTVRTEGLPGLWRGHSATLLRIAPYAGLHYAAHEALVEALASCHASVCAPSALERFAAGAGAGAAATVVTYPLDLLRARLALGGLSLSCALRELAQGGPRAAFRGLGPTLAGIVPYSGVTWLGYTTLKEEGGADSPAQRLAAGALAGLLGQSVTYPLDVARRRMQVGAPGGAAHVLRSAVAAEGTAVLFKGLSLNWLKGPVATAVSFFVFEAVVEQLKQRGRGDAATAT